MFTIPPTLKLLFRNPHLIVEHVLNYALLFGAEAQNTIHYFVRNIVCWVVLALSIAVAFIFAGVALMIGVLQGQFHWILLVVPLTMLIPAAIAAFLIKKPLLRPAIQNITAQLAADIQVWQQKD